MIVIEGMDNCGKTTLAHNIIHELKKFNIKNVEYQHSPGPDTPENMVNRTYEYLRMANDKKNRILFDRLHVVSDQVYAQVLSRTNVFKDTPEGVRVLRAFILAQPLIIYCRPSMDRIVGFEDGRDQMKGVKENSFELIEAYDRLMGSLNQHPEIGRWSVLYDYTKEFRDFKKVVVKVRNYILEPPGLSPEMVDKILPPAKKEE